MKTANRSMRAPNGKIRAKRVGYYYLFVCINCPRSRAWNGTTLKTTRGTKRRRLEIIVIIITVSVIKKKKKRHSFRKNYNEAV